MGLNRDAPTPWYVGGVCRIATHSSKLGHGNHTINVRLSAVFQNVFRPHDEGEKQAFSICGLNSVSEKLHFCDLLMWTVGFISPGWCGRALRSSPSVLCRNSISSPMSEGRGTSIETSYLPYIFTPFLPHPLFFLFFPYNYFKQDLIHIINCGLS